MNGAPPPPPRPRPCAQPGAVAVWQLYGHCRSVPRAPGPGCKLRSLSLAPARLRTRRSALLSFAVRRSRVPSPCLQLLARHTLASLTRSSRLRPTPLSHGGPIISCSKPASATLFLPPFCLAPAATVADTVAGGSSPLQDPLCPWPCLTGFIPGTTAHFGSLNAHRRIARYFYSWRWAWYTGPVCLAICLPSFPPGPSPSTFAIAAIAPFDARQRPRRPRLAAMIGDALGDHRVSGRSSILRWCGDRRVRAMAPLFPTASMKHGRSI